MARAKFNGTVWEFKTARLRVALEIARDRYTKYDGFDEDGKIQEELDNGELIMFDSRVVVYLTNAQDGEIEIGSDHLGSSVYGRDTIEEFWTAHRDSDPMNRNSSILRAARGDNVCVCHYFPDMVRLACRQAREILPLNR